MYLNHLTLTTGHLARTARADVDDGAVVFCRELIDEALAARRPIRMRPEDLSAWTLEVTAAGSALVATLSEADGRPLITLGVAPRSTMAPRLWEELRELAPYHTVERPAAPWAAVVLLDPDIPDWVGDFERCLAWAWIEQKT